MSTTLTQDFIQDGKTFMVIQREEGFQHSDLSRTQSGMMLSSRIRGILQLHLHEVNLQAQLRYDITGKRMLKHCLQSEMIGIAEYFGLLLQLVTTLEESSQYMLSLSNYVLDEDYMFVEGSLQAGKLFLTYIPCTVMLTEEPVQQQIGKLASHWMTAVRELSGNDVQRILRYCQSDTFTLPELKYMLMDLLAGGQEHHDQSSVNSPMRMPRPGDRDWNGGYGGRMNPADQGSMGDHYGQSSSFANGSDMNGRHSSQASSYGMSAERGNDAPLSASMNPRTIHQAGHPAAHGSSIPHAPSHTKSDFPEVEKKRSLLSFGKKKESSAGSLNIQPDTGDMETEPPKLPSAYRTYILAGGALLVAMIWRYGYMEHANDMMLYGCSALTIATILTIYMIIKGKIALGKTSKAVEDTSKAMPSKPAVSLFGKKKQHNDEANQEAWRWQPELAGQSAAAMSATHKGNAGYPSSIPAAGNARNGNQATDRSMEQAFQREQSAAELFGRSAAADASQRGNEFKVGNAYGGQQPTDFSATNNTYSYQADSSQSAAGQGFRGGQPNDYTEHHSIHTSQPSYAAQHPNNHANPSGFDHSEQSMQINNTPTQSLSSHMATVFLDDLEPQSHEEQSVFRGYLERREANGHSIETIRLGVGSFIIGRADDGVHYHEKSVGTSRNHVELEVRKGQVMIKDLSSRNGTILNGEALIPYKAYPIQNGDSFKVAKAMYTLRLEM